MKPVKRAATSSSKDNPGSFLGKLRRRRIIETLAAFIGGGWLLLEFVHWLLVDHYHFPEKTIDVTFVTILGTLLCSLIWRWFSSREKPRKFKLELVLIPLIVLITVLLDINLLLHLRGTESETIPASKWKNSIAVLPFDNISPEQGQDYFCDGLTDELITRLSNIKDLKVIARTSVFSFKGKEIDIRDIGKKLNVATVLEGGVRKAGDKLRITAQLINVSDGSHIWSDSYDKELTDIFAIQDEIALVVTDKLKLTLLGEEKEKLAKRPTENLEAYDLYLQGRNLWNKRNEVDLIKSIEYFEKAIDIDPNYALAYAGLGDTYVVIGNYGLWSPARAYPKGKASALKALEIDDRLAEAHASLADFMSEYDWDFVGAEKEYRRAIELNPGYATARQWYASFLSWLGRHEEAISEFRIARNLDPLSPIISLNVGAEFYAERQYNQALEELNKALEVDPKFWITHMFIGLTYEAMGQYEEAVKYFLRYIELSGESEDRDYNIASCYALMGRRDEAQKILNNLIVYSKENYVPSSYIALVFSALGEKDQAFVWLEKAFQDRGSNLLDYITDHRLDPVRSDPRFTDLLRRIGLEK
jgi:TolB-like protein